MIIIVIVDVLWVFFGTIWIKIYCLVAVIGILPHFKPRQQNILPWLITAL
jgi:hypothetical protein